ncbi:MAG: hypothetical protein ABEK84_04560, partial [Salinibacter sp.]
MSGDQPPWAALYHDPLPVGGIAVGLLLGTYALFGVSVDLPLLGAGFGGTALAYAVDRVWADTPEDRINRPERVAWIRAHPRWLAVETAVLFALTGSVLPYLTTQTLLWSAGLGTVAGLRLLVRGDAAPVVGGPRKPIAIAGAWAAGGALLPLVEAGSPIGPGVMLFFGYRWLFILPNLLVADWGDRAGDAEVGMAPWATAWTAKQVQGAATSLLLVALGGAVGWAVVGDAPVLVALDACGPLLMLGVVWGLEPGRSR